MTLDDAKHELHQLRDMIDDLDTVTFGDLASHFDKMMARCNAAIAVIDRLEQEVEGGEPA